MPTGGPEVDVWGEDDNARRYDAFARQHPIYRDTARDLIALAGLSADAAVLDLACGTGVTTREILAALGAGGRVTGADQSAAMLAVAARAGGDPRMTWVKTPAENVDRHVAAPIDAVVCNSAIWQTDLAATAAAVRNLLVTGGRLAFNVGAGFLGQQADPNFPDDRPSPIAIMRDIAAQDYGWRPPAPATAPSRRPRLTQESIGRYLDEAGFDVEQVAEFTYQSDAAAERAWLSIPVFTQIYLPGLPYEDRMRVLAKAYARLGTGPTEPERWIAFAARKRGALLAG
jgi:SAM-dependent methyltransferase